MTAIEESESWLRGDWMQTHTRRRFYPMDPRPEDIDSEDIAHALSLLCRYGGHIDRFYSVAEHCVLMSQMVAPENALHALLHDATEAYVVDVPRPLKRYLADYRMIEDKVWQAIAVHFNVDPVLPAEVHEADSRILLSETAVLMPGVGVWASLQGLTALPVHISGWTPMRAKVEYLARLAELTA
jgi:uncharacterized protein